MNKYELMLNLVKKHQGKQSRNNGKVPYWHHCKSVSEILKYFLLENGEIREDDPILETILLATIGHDLYEDTDISKDEIINSFSKEVNKFIFGMTNEEGDHNTKKYIQKIKSSAEEVKLIKLADMIDNTMSCAYGIHDNGVEWTKNFLLPIIEDMKKIMLPDSFTKYSKTGLEMIKCLKFAHGRLQENINKFANNQ